MEITTKAVPESPANGEGRREKAEPSNQVSREHSRKGAGWMGTAASAGLQQHQARRSLNHREGDNPLEKKFTPS